MNYSDIRDYLDYCYAYKRLSQHTIRAYQNDLYQYYRHHTDDLKDYIDYLRENVEKTNTLKRKIASLKAFYTYLEEEGRITQNPFHRLRFKFRTEKNLPKIIPLNELELLYAHLRQKVTEAKTAYATEKAQRNYLIVSLLLSTGLRISELCHIRLGEIDLPNRSVTIMGKGRKERTIYLGDDRTFHLLEEFITCYSPNKNTYLFLGKDKISPLSEQSVRLMLKNAQQQTSLSKTITPHMFRHSFATMLLDNNVDIRYIQQILGHSSIAVTQIYTHVSQNKQQEILTNHNPIKLLLLD